MAAMLHENISLQVVTDREKLYCTRESVLLGFAHYLQSSKGF